VDDLECIVVGGGAAGLSAALVLGRARRKTLLIDAGEQSNRAATAIGGFLGADGEAPGDFYARQHAALERYPSVSVHRGSVVDGGRSGDMFEITDSDALRMRAPTVLLAMGMEYRPPATAGIGERWGKSVFHCPFCHGWEVRGKPLGVLDDGESAAHRARLLTAWSDDVTVYTNGRSGDPSIEQPGLRVDGREILELLGTAPDLTAIHFRDGSERRCEGLLVPVTLHQRSDLATRLGARLTEVEPLTSEAIEVDAVGAAAVPGLYAAGDLTGKMPSVANAVASGSNAAAAVVGLLSGALPAR